jgi:hypothetical protein
MEPNVRKRRILLGVREKILAVLLIISITALGITGFFALLSIQDMGTYAKQQSAELGERAVQDSSLALEQSAEESLLRLATTRPTSATGFLNRSSPRCAFFPGTQKGL